VRGIGIRVYIINYRWERSERRAVNDTLLKRWSSGLSYILLLGNSSPRAQLHRVVLCHISSATDSISVSYTLPQSHCASASSTLSRRTIYLHPLMPS
jgi:hypothetical protein